MLFTSAPADKASIVMEQGTAHVKSCILKPFHPEFNAFSAPIWRWPQVVYLSKPATQTPLPKQCVWHIVKVPSCPFYFCQSCSIILWGTVVHDSMIFKQRNIVLCTQPTRAILDGGVSKVSIPFLARHLPGMVFFLIQDSHHVPKTAFPSPNKIFGYGSATIGVSFFSLSFYIVPALLL